MFKEYMTPFLISFVIAAIAGPLLIPVLRIIKAGQTVRDDGPQSHLKKNGTPTMGGVIFLLAFGAGAVYYIATAGEAVQNSLILLLQSVFGFAIIGFIDDFIKVVLKRSMGLRAWQKFGLQIVLTLFLLYRINCEMPTGLGQLVPFSGEMIELGFMLWPLLFIAFLGTVNGANFTDGLDGLATKVTAVIAAFFALAAASQKSVSWVGALLMFGALMGFLLYNSHKASVFMGDTGSLALGGFVIMLAVQLHLVLYVIIIAFIYLAEVASVILQVGYFKLTHGKRIFKMAPIHHHFELCGWSETKVVAVFTIVTMVLCAISALFI